MTATFLTGSRIEILRFPGVHVGLDLGYTLAPWCLLALPGSVLGYVNSACDGEISVLITTAYRGLTYTNPSQRSIFLFSILRG